MFLIIIQNYKIPSIRIPVDFIHSPLWRKKLNGSHHKLAMNPQFTQNGVEGVPFLLFRCLLIFLAQVEEDGLSQSSLHMLQHIKDFFNPKRRGSVNGVRPIQ